MQYFNCYLLFIAFCISVLVAEQQLNKQKISDQIIGKNMKIEQPKRPQEPQPPYPYYEEEVLYKNSHAEILLSGTLTIPSKQGIFPAVLLIAGYGPNDRNLTSMGHKYFLVLADYLTRQGIAVLRVDKRGIGKSTGIYETATTQDFASDVLAGVEYLKTRSEINAQQIGLIGLSEGGLIASMVAAQSNDIAFIVLMAPAILSKTEDLVEATALQLQADGASKEFIKSDKKLRSTVYTIIKQERDTAKAQELLKLAIENYWADLPEAQKQEAEKLPFAFTKAKTETLIKVFNSPWYRFFLTYNPIETLQSIKIPVLAINGNCDWIAPSHKIFSILEGALEKAGNKDYTLVELPNLNHTFQTCKTGALGEYATIKETMSLVALQTIAKWILARTALSK